ncbi:AraC family transcriptional regulator [Clostridium sp. YIM B02505]|uniref:AraC family transcriptional regulator n=1 Tax=Clostridium yunnanense TaxID=2800325 RepID=A0ABS1ERM0_9CLOT|nr:AraC family transcriptional regulator [Clostridium yunnanense]MBK1812022.1 AraC family transcriptional regulator [Clostridium yunnanense]
MLQEFNKVMEYIEDNLTEDIEVEKIAQIARASEYHFRKMFSYISGMSLSEYIKNRRLANANVDLINGEKVTDVAFKYGYQSVDGFTRAFKAWTGILPSEVIKTKVQKSFPKFSFYLNIRGGVSMEFRIEEKKAFNIIGVSKRVPIQFEGVNNVILELAKSITEQQRAEMHEFKDMYPHRVVNASYDFDDGVLEEKGELAHMIGFVSEKTNKFEDLEEINVPALTWAIFPNEGLFPMTLQSTWAQIYSEWLPSSEYELVKAPSISFTEHDKGTESKYSEIWIAVRKK